MDKTNASSQALERKYALIPLSFHDLWEDRDIEFKFRFAKPTKLEVKRLQDTAVKNPTQAAINILASTVHPDDKEALQAAMEEYPGISTSYSTALIKAIGLTADAGN